MTHIHILKVRCQDAPFLHKLMNTASVLIALNEVPTQLSDWSDAVSYWENDPDEEDYIIFLDTLPIGWLGVNGLLSENRAAYIKMFALLPEYQGKGIGTYVLNQVVQSLLARDYLSIALFTNQDNLTAQACYRKCGFCVTDTFMDTMSNGEVVQRYKMEYCKPHFHMKAGIQVSSLKPLLRTDAEVDAAFAKMRALGCHTVQLQWIDPTVSADAVALALRENGIASVSVQDFYETVRENWDYYTSLNAATGGTWLCVSRIPERLKSREGLDAFLGELRDMQKQLDTLEQKLCFHPVSADFTAVPGMDAVEYLFENMPQLDICLDLYHLNRNCGDMPGFIRRYAGRICMVHFKDAVGEELVPAGQGDTNWSGVVKACLDAKVPYAFVEQERWNRDPYDCLKEAMDWLDREIGEAAL